MFHRSTDGSVISVFLIIALAGPHPGAVGEEPGVGGAGTAGFAALSNEYRSRSKDRVEIDYVFSSQSSRIDLPLPGASEAEDELDVEEFLGAIEGNPRYDLDRIEAPQLRLQDRDVENTDFVGDFHGRGGIGADEPVWGGTHADTLLRTQVADTATGAHPTSARRGTSFGNGYIPEYDEAPRLEDEPPFSGSYVDARAYDRLPHDWVVPPGGRRADGAYAGPRYYDDYPAYQYNNTLTNSHYQSGGSSSYSYDGERIHHPEGPYSYRYGIRDPFWSDESRTFYEDSGYEITGGWPIFTRSFNPEDAHLKVGAFYLQVVSAEVGVLYSDYDGPQVFRPGEEDGFLGYSSFRLRAAARIAPDLYFTLDGEVIYIFGENELGFRSGGGIGDPFLRFEYRKEVGTWTIRIYDHLGTYVPVDYRFGDGAFDQAGRYSFGFLGYDRRSTRNDFFYDPVIYNRVGVEAKTPLNESWRLVLEADHSDYFRLGDDSNGDDHTSQQHASVGVYSQPDKVPFSPYARYDVYRSDNVEGLLHSFYVGGSGRVSERVTVDGRFGYLFQTGNLAIGDRWLWSIGIRHQIAERTHHGVTVGQDLFVNPFSDDILVSDYVRYDFSHFFSERLWFTAFAQWSQDDVVSGPLGTGHITREQYGVRVRHQTCENVDTSVGYRVEEWDGGTLAQDRKRSIFDVHVNARINSRSDCYFLYQFEDDTLFTEDLYAVGMRRYF